MKKDEGSLPVSERGRLRLEKRKWALCPMKKDEGCLPVSERGHLRPEKKTGLCPVVSDEELRNR